MQTLTNNAPVLREKLAHRQKYQSRELWHRLTLYKWKIHFDRVITNVFEEVGWSDPPVDFEPLHQYLAGYKVEYLDIEFFPTEILPHNCTKYETVEGRNFVAGDCILIFSDESVSETRRRFTLAHEWGHIFQFFDEEFKADMEAIPNPLIRQDIIECIANSFASSYLMPTRLLKEAVAHLPMFPADPQLTAQFTAHSFKVSPQAMNYRLMDYAKRIQQ